MCCPFMKAIMDKIKARDPKLYRDLIYIARNTERAYKVESINGNPVDTVTYFVPAKRREQPYNVLGNPPAWMHETIDTQELIHRCDEKAQLYKLALKAQPE